MFNSNDGLNESCPNSRGTTAVESITVYCWRGFRDRLSVDPKVSIAVVRGIVVEVRVIVQALSLKIILNT